ncbi:dsDNA nuclease domain-containing protein [Roseivivax halodurans]|uniref:dsDNA nuclease domain-containing protein n=1 Tax=Roseivivax halodurans TaxID=93683 RepID=UPI000A023043|nr:dsDNA nuclease domain-containing protein [Roseivivax halodurans]
MPDFESKTLSSLKQKLATTKPREDSGAPTASRYHFQALCGLVLALERHKLDGDYALVFEFHDDIAIFDNSVNPQKVKFYQVKSKKNGHWTTAALTKRDAKKREEAFSYLGKMYQNVVVFSGSVESSTFLSNAPAKFAPGDKQSFSLSECDDVDLEGIIKKLKEEFSDEDTIKSELLWIEKSDLSLDDADTHAKGKLEAFVVEHLGEVEFSLSALFKAVSEECTSKARATKTDLADYDDVVAQRGITRQDTEGWLQAVSATVSCPKWEEIAPEINLPAPQKIRLRREWNAYRVAVLNPNEAVRKIRRMIAEHLYDHGGTSMDLNGLLASAFSALEGSARAELGMASDERIKAMILYEAYSIE